jgi:hypothetical protein
MAVHIRRVRHAVYVLLTVSSSLFASPVSDFQARLAQTAWNLHQTEALLRAQPQSSGAAAATPEALGSYLALLSENTSALNALTTQKMTDEQRRVMAEGLRSIGGALRDQVSLANNRGLNAASLALSLLETNCRSAFSALN